MSIKHAILGILSCKQLTGYDLKKIMQDSEIMPWSGNNNQIYKALIELLNDGFVTNEVLHQENAPSKKIYTITEKGLAALGEWVSLTPHVPEYKKPFLIQLSWADLLTTDELLELLSKYEREVRVQLLVHREKVKRGNGFEARTTREDYLWKMIDENVGSSIQYELDWIQHVRNRLF